MKSLDFYTVVEILKQIYNLSKTKKNYDQMNKSKNQGYGNALMEGQ